MTKDNTVYLLVGPRGSGKTHYSKSIITAQPKIHLVSRDEILMRKFGSTDCSPYEGNHYYAEEVLDRFLRRYLSTRTGARIILDTWTGTSNERRGIMGVLRDEGATRVVALYFVTSAKMVNTWFWKKPGVAKTREMGTRHGEDLTFFSPETPRRDHKLFHEYASTINSDGFDEVIRVNPLKPLIVLQ